MSVAGLLLGDSRFPAGGHAHSGGVEPAVTAGTVTDVGSLEAFLRGRLRTSGLVAAGIAAAACGHVRDTSQLAQLAPGKPAERVPDDYWPLLDAEADARIPSPAQREASRRQGRALLRATRVAWPDAAGLAELAASIRPGSGNASGGPRSTSGAGATVEAHAGCSASRVAASGDSTASGSSGDVRREYRGGPHHAVVLGVAAAAAGCAPGEAARIAAYQAVAGPVSAAVRLLALDPMKATAVLARLAGEIDQVAESGAAQAGGPLSDLPCASAPALELLAEAHIEAEVRLFES